MHIPLNDTGRLFAAHKTQLESLFSDVGRSGWLLNGKYNRSFSESFADYCGTKYCIPVGNGTDALELALRAVINEDTGNKAEVITVANAGGYATIACHLIGAVPVYADILTETQLVNPNSIINCLSKRTQAIVITHLYGGVVDVKKIRLLLQNRGFGQIPIVEDCAQAHGGKIDGYRVGSLGDLAAFSFYPTKNLGAFGDAGAVTTSNSELYARVKQLSQYGWQKKYSVNVRNGRNSRMDEIQAGILNYFLPFLDEHNRRRISIYNEYRRVAGDSLNFLQSPATVAHLGVVQTEKRESFIKHLQASNIASAIHYPILDHEQKAWSILPFKTDPESGLSCSQKSVKKIVSIPCFPQLLDKEVEHICETLRGWGDAN